MGNKVTGSAVDEEYYDDAQVAQLLGISLGSLRNKLCAGDPLPPRLHPSGLRKRLWPQQELHDWLEVFRAEGGRRVARGFLRRT